MMHKLKDLIGYPADQVICHLSIYAHDIEYGEIYLNLPEPDRARLADYSKSELEWFLGQWDRRGLSDALRLCRCIRFGPRESQRRKKLDIENPDYYFHPRNTGSRARDALMQWLLYNDEPFRVPLLAKQINVKPNTCAVWALHLMGGGFIVRERASGKKTFLYSKTPLFETAFGGYREHIAG